MNTAPKMLEKSGLQVADSLVAFIESEVLPGLAITADQFWRSLANLVSDLTPRNKALLKERESLQSKIDDWCLQHRENFDADKYKAFLEKIGYLVDEQEGFSITTQNVDTEIAQQAGPQLVVPTSNARFALNATNARWGSLYDALYGTDVISEDEGATRDGPYNPLRGEKVIAYCRQILDQHFPLSEGSHVDSIAYFIADGQLQVSLSNGVSVALAAPEQCVGPLIQCMACWLNLRTVIEANDSRCF